MKKFYYKALVFAMLLVPFDSALARGGGQSWLLGIDLSYLSNKAESVVSSTTSTAESSTTFYDVTLGYMLTPNVLVGGIYTTKNTSTKGASLSTSTNGSAAGASVGYVFDNGVHISGSYLLNAVDDEYKKGSGYQIDLGWRSFLSDSFFVGAKLAYRSIKYTENQTLAGFTSLTNTTAMPYISIGFGF